MGEIIKRKPEYTMRLGDGDLYFFSQGNLRGICRRIGESIEEITYYLGKYEATVGIYEVICPAKFAKIRDYSWCTNTDGKKRGAIFAKLPGEMWGIIDMEGNFITQPCYYELKETSSFYLLLISPEGLLGLLALNGEVITPTKWEAIEVETLGRYDFGYAKVRLNGKWGIISNTGAEIAEPVYDEILPFLGEYCSVKKNNKWGVINKAGVVCDCIYDGPVCFWTNGSPNTISGFASVKKDGFYGVIDANFNEISPCVYDEVHEFWFGKAIVRRNGKYGLIDESGQEIIKTIYDQMSQCGDWVKIGPHKVRVGYSSTMEYEDD